MEQEDIIKHLRGTQAEKSLISEAAKTLINLKKDLALAEVEELLESNEYGFEAKPDWTKNPDIGLDWNSVPVIHDAHYDKFKKEIRKLKLQLKIEKKSNERIKDELKSKMTKHEANEEYEKQRKAQAKTDKEIFEQKSIKQYKAMQAKFRDQRTKAQSQRKHSSRLRNKINYLESDKKKDIIKKQGIKDFVHSKFKGRAQRTCLLKNLKKARCDKYDICESLVLRALGRGCYKHLKKTGPVYYPSIATQDRHLNGLMSCRPGYVANIISTMTKLGESWNDEFRLVKVEKI